MNSHTQISSGATLPSMMTQYEPPNALRAPQRMHSETYLHEARVRVEQ